MGTERARVLNGTGELGCGRTGVSKCLSGMHVGLRGMHCAHGNCEEPPLREAGGTKGD